MKFNAAHLLSLVAMRRTSTVATIAMSVCMLPVAAAAQNAPPGPAAPAGAGPSAEPIDPNFLRVCSDPSNMPFSNEAGQGFENKIAELLAGKLGKKVSYAFFPMATGFVRKTLKANKCDVIIGYPQGADIALPTRAYYRTAYALVFKKGSDLEGVTTLEDPKLKTRKIGVVAGTPPGNNMAVNGLLTNAHSYPLVIDTRVDSSSKDMIKDLKDGSIDVGILWGPMAGYFAKQETPPLMVVPLVEEKAGPPLAYDIAMGVRQKDKEWKRQLDELIAANQVELNKILLDYGVPLIDAKNARVTAATTSGKP